MKNQIPSDTREKLIRAINTTKEFLNHEFLNHIISTNSVNPSEWAWVNKPWLVIFGEKPNLPNELYTKLENLYTKVFQFEANKFIEICKNIPEEEITGLKGENARKLDAQYDKWRTDFTIEANRVINELEVKKDVSEGNRIQLLKEFVAEGKIENVLTQLIDLYQKSFEEQNILYELSFRRNKLEREIHLGIRKNEEIELEQNKIVTSILKMIDGLNK